MDFFAAEGDAPAKASHIWRDLANGLGQWAGPMGRHFIA